MSYTSLDFVLFSLAVLIIYYIAGAINGKFQKYVLLAASVVFYYVAGAKYFPYLGATLLSTFIGALVLDRIHQKEDKKLADCENIEQKKAVKKAAKAKARVTLTGFILVPIALLVVCKYLGFIINNLNAVIHALGNGGTIEMVKLALPVGISFYTFMALSYILDIYWRRYKVEKNIFAYAAFLTYFPHVVQGPFDRYNKFKEQTENGVRFDPDNIRSGVLLLLWGFFKKLVIADQIAIFVDAIYDHYTEYYGLVLVLATIAYSIQIYADFSGCIDIVSGISECFGIKLAKNFNHPYFSRSMLEFWRRWHISLQEWFKDYIYFPVFMSALVKKVKKATRKKKTQRFGELFSSCFPIFVVWMITGIWHGANWKYVAWGLFHAFLLISSKIFERSSAKLTKSLKLRTESWGFSLFQIVRTFTLCCIGRVFFRAPGLRASAAIFKAMVSGVGYHFIRIEQFENYGLDYKMLFFLILCCLVLLTVDALAEKIDIRQKLVKENGFILRAMIILLLVFTIIIFGIYGPGYNAATFIYQEF